MKQKWSYKDLINLEYFLHKDTNDPPKQLHKRDRSIFLTKENQTATSSPDNHGLISIWLKERIGHEFSDNDNRSPGEIFQDTFSLLKGLCTIGGGLFGIAAGLSFFTYSGTAPVNVFQFLIFFVFSQIFLTLLMGFSFAARRLIDEVSLPTFYSLLLGRLFTKLAQLTCRKWNKQLSAEKKNSINHAMGLIKSQRRIYGSLFYWPLFTLSQTIAIFFNSGLLGATLFKISTSDLAFGWQSTMQISTAALHKLVQLMAFPWSWFIPGAVAFPSPKEIEGSRILLKEGIYHLETKDLVSWWPFLIFCILFYGLFFRGGCYLFGRWMETRSLKKVKFNSASCRRLIQRMLTPLISTQAQPETRTEGGKATTEINQYKQKPEHSLLPQFVLIPSDIYHSLPLENFKQLLFDQGFAVEKVLKFMADYDSDQQLKQFLKGQSWDGSTGLFILMEGWMVPLIDFLTYLQELRSAVSADTLITVGLTGRPTQTVFTAVSKNEYTIWRQKITTLGDPYLHLLPLKAVQRT